MWPIERCVLVKLLGSDRKNEIETSYYSGLKNVYIIFSQLSKKKITKTAFYHLYDQTFETLEQGHLLPSPEPFPLVAYLKQDADNFHMVYATGGRKQETWYVLRSLDLISLFDLQHSLDKSVCRFSKQTSIPFKKIKADFPNCRLITDSESDCFGAKKAGIQYTKIKPRQAFLKRKLRHEVISL